MFTGWMDGKSWKKAIEFFEKEYIQKLDYSEFVTDDKSMTNDYDCEYCA